MLSYCRVLFLNNIANKYYFEWKDENRRLFDLLKIVTIRNDIWAYQNN